MQIKGLSIKSYRRGLVNDTASKKRLTVCGSRRGMHLPFEGCSNKRFGPASGQPPAIARVIHNKACKEWQGKVAHLKKYALLNGQNSMDKQCCTCCKVSTRWKIVQ